MIRKSIIVVLTLGAIAIGIVWIHSYRWRDDIVRRGAWTEFAAPVEGSIIIIASSGTASLVWGSQSPPVSWSNDERSIPTSQIFLRYLGGSYGVTATSKYRYVAFWIRLWLLFALVAAYPTITFIRGPLQRWRRHRKGLCLKCGYNLRGLTEPRCPECSTEFDPSTMPSTD